jgi:hypothetical protein
VIDLFKLANFDVGGSANFVKIIPMHYQKLFTYKAEAVQNKTVINLRSDSL